MKGFTLLEVLVSLIVVLIGFSILISTQSFLVSQSINNLDIIRASKIASEISFLLTAADSRVEKFDGNYAEFLQKFRVPPRLLELFDFNQVSIALELQVKPLPYEKEINAEIYDISITFPSGKAFKYHFLSQQHDD
ncbi:MAG: prepilin-type N-terminal cleavage/methylation domain-containing protein [Deltaproteobacteria bacterium]|nr:prepilin-type N-terminal cleavage/methylation domain-containing protein [Deltaproteobacteria bacterium]